MNKFDRYEIVKEVIEKLRKKASDNFQCYNMSVVNLGDLTDILEEYENFNCDVCKKHCYFASPCTSDDCEARHRDFKEKNNDRRAKVRPFLW